MVDWKNYKGNGPWDVVIQRSKTYYNEGSYISSMDNPVWDLDKVSGNAICTSHKPCGYWFKDPVIPTYGIYAAGAHHEFVGGSGDYSYINTVLKESIFIDWGISQSHSLFLDAKGVLYAVGKPYQAVGKKYAVPNYIAFDSEIIIPVDSGPWVSIGCTDDHFMGIKEDGTLWVSGYNYNDNGALGLGPIGDTSVNLTRVGNRSDWKSVGTLYLGTSSVIDMDNNLYICGDFSAAVDGNVDNYYLEHALSNCTWCFYMYDMIVAISNGKLYGAGRNGKGQLGLGFTEPENPNDYHTYPFTLSSVTFDSRIIKAVTGHYASMFMTESGKLYVIDPVSYNTYALSGLGYSVNSVTLIPGIKVKDIASSYWQFYYLTEEGRIYYTGRGIFWDESWTGPLSNSTKYWTIASNDTFDMITSGYRHFIAVKDLRK